MKKVELVYDEDCPNIELAREQIKKAINQVGLSLSWKEWDRSDPEAPSYVRKYASPTVLVVGQDVAGSEGIDGDSGCRVYQDENGRMFGAPPVDMIVSALATAQGTGRGSSLAVLPALGAAALPVLSCPACWPAYAGLLSSLGVGFINYTPYLLPLMIILLLVAVASLAYKARARHGYKPALLGIAAAVLILMGRFWIGGTVALYIGITVLVVASAWNAWPRSKKV